MTTIPNPQPQPTDGNPEAPEGTAIPTGRQAGGGDVAPSPVIAREPPGDLPVRGELDATIAGGEDPPDPRPRRTTRSRRTIRAGTPLEQPTKPGSPPRTELSERLIVENQGLARKAANKWSRLCGRPYDDFIGPALEGLVNGCRRYDPERLNPGTGRPYAISTCVCQYIEGQIKHHIRDHGYDIKMPSKWREYYPKVRRLLAEGLTLAQVVEAIPVFTEAELAEMMGAMVGTVELEDEITLFSNPQPEAVDETLAAALFDLTEQAFSNLRPADRAILERWAEDPFKRPFPSGPILQFHHRVKLQLRGTTLQQFRQGVLGIDVATKPALQTIRNPRQPRPAVAPVVQPSLFGRNQRKPHPKAVKL
jgi:hypothetical protein